MRILQLCNRVPFPPHDGGAIAMLNMTKAFHKLGHQLHLLCLNTRKHYISPDRLPPLFKELASYKAIDIDTDLSSFNAFTNLVFTRKPYHISRFYSRGFEKELIAALKVHDFDIIHIEGLHMCLYIDTIRKYTKAKISLRAHNLEYLIWERMAENTRNPIKKYYLNILAARLLNFEMRAVHKIDALVPITVTDALVFKDINKQLPIFVSPTGLDLDDYNTDKKKQEWPGIFHLGALDWMPNIQAIEWFLSEVWPKVHKDNPKLKFYIAGRNTPEHLKQLKTVGIEVVGEVENAVDFMNSKSIMVVPLLSGSGMRIKIIEGMALAKTIISTTIGAEGIHYTDQKDIIIADTPEAFYFAIKKCLQNQDFANQVGKSARLLAEKEYSNLVLVEKLVGFYEGLG
jgi:glycosyltransferase involved in cell wall biosynthesis